MTFLAASRGPSPGRFALGCLAALVLSQGCSSSSSSSGPAPGPTGTTVLFDLSADLASPAHFFDFPWPSDLRLSSAGTPDLRGMPNPLSSSVVQGLIDIAQQNTGYPAVPVAWFRFTADLAPRQPTNTVAAAASSPVLLVDVDPASPDRGKLYPTIAETIAADAYVPSGVLGVAVRPGIVLEARRKYAFVVMSSANDAQGKPL